MIKRLSAVLGLALLAMLARPAFATDNTPAAYDLCFPYSGTPLAGQTVNIPVDRQLLIPASMVGSHIALSVNPTAAQTFTLGYNGTAVGTITISTGGSPTFVLASPITTSPGDVLTLIAPSPADRTLSNPAINIATTVLGVSYVPDGGVAGWVTDFDCDFSAQGNFTFADAGPVTICGVTWTFINYGQFYSAPQLISGAGLSLTPTDPSSWSGSVWSAPALVTSLQGLAPDLDPTTPVEVLYYAQYLDGGPNNNGILAGVSNGVTDAGTTVWYAASTANYATGSCGTGFLAYSVLGGASLGGACTTSANNVGVVELPAGVAGLDATFLSGVYPGDGGWGVSQVWSPIGTLKTSGNMLSTSISLNGSLAPFQLVVGAVAYNGGTALNFTGTVGRVQVRHYRQ